MATRTRELERGVSVVDAFVRHHDRKEKTLTYCYIDSGKEETKDDYLITPYRFLKGKTRIRIHSHQGAVRRIEPV